MTDQPQASSLRILISRLSAHGDVVQALPLLSALKARYPGCFIGWVVEASAAPLLEGHPLIDKLHVSQRKAWLAGLNFSAFWGFVQELRQSRYDIGLDVQGLMKSAVWLWLAGIPRRIGFDKSREQAALLYTEKLPPHVIRNTTQSAVHKYLELAVAAGCAPDQPEIQIPVFQTPPVSSLRQNKISSLLAGLRSPKIVLAPRTIWPTKHWTDAGWLELSRRLAQLPVSQILIGGPTDKPLPVDPSVLNLTGQTDLPDLYALFEETDILVGLDSAPLHIANAVGRPRIIGIYGPTAPGRTGPVGAPHKTLQTSLSCQPCFERMCPIQTHACMTELRPEAVLAAIQEMLP